MNGKQVYEKIADAYGAYWPEHPMDKAKAIMQLEKVIEQVSPEVLIKKAKAAALAHGDNRCKLSLLISSEYWRMRYPSESQPEFVIKRSNPHQK